jgi:TrmH family RNA methyltransferase
MLTKTVLKHIKQLQQKKIRKESREFVIEGIKGVKEVLLSNYEVLALIIEGDRRDEAEMKELSLLATKKGIVVEFCGRNDVNLIKTTDTFPGILAVVGEPETELENLTDGPIVCLNRINDPGNLGTIIRTADWFDVQNILLSEDSVDPYNDKVVRSTMGSIFHVNIFSSTNVASTLEKLKNKYGFRVNALDMKGDSINQIKPSKKEIYLFGSESHGISPELDRLIDKRYTIAGNGKAESLNVGVAVGILLSKI